MAISARVIMLMLPMSPKAKKGRKGRKSDKKGIFDFCQCSRGSIADISMYDGILKNLDVQL